MKFLLFLLVSVSASFALAMPVDGTIFYKLPSGEIVDREVVIDVPARGQGEVVLSGNGFEWKTTDFWSENSNGRTVFIAAFQSEMHNHQSTIVLKGSYINGENRVLYYGDFYKKAGHDPVDKELTGFNFAGGFSFEYLANN